MVAALLLFLFTAAPHSRGVSSTCQPGALQIRVTDRGGKPLGFAHVKVQGAAQHEGDTNAAGCVTFNELEAGQYLVRVKRDAFITLEKEFRIVPGKSARVVAALSRETPRLASRSRR
jgi:Carboxypeptidase regulatory-like domain